MTNVLELSLNTGAVFVQQQTGQKEFRAGVEAFGFDETTDIDLAGEARGDLGNLENQRPIEYATASFGQGIAVTPIGLLRAFGALANDGVMVRPHVVRSIVRPNGSNEAVEPEEQGRTVSARAASQLTSMLVSVVENGFGEKAAVPGYAVAGKTGTAQVPDPESGGYLEDETIHSFVGFAPAFDPRFVMLVKIDEPANVRFSSDSTAPVWGEIAQFILQYLEIPPTR